MSAGRPNIWSAAWAAGLCLLLIVAIAMLSPKPMNDAILRRPSTFFTDPGGARAVYLVLQRVLPSAGQWRLPLKELKKPSGKAIGSLIVMRPEPLGQSEATALDEWISSGGQLILASNSDWVIQASARNPVKNFLGRHDISTSVSGRSVEGAVIKSVGRGRIIYVPDDYAFSNSNLGKTDNAVWLAERCSEWGGGALFDEYHLGFTEQRGLISLLALFVVTPWGLVCAQLSLAGLIYIFGCKRRFGQPLQELPVERTNPIETVQALAGLFKTARARALAARSMQQHLNAYVSSILGYRIDLMDAGARERFAGPLGIERSTLDAYAKAAGTATSENSLSDAAFIQFGKNATAIARSLSYGLGRGRRSGVTD
jgi:hypothetical protein